MHPILEDRRHLAIYLLAWALIGVLLAVGLRTDASWETAVALLLPLSFVYAFIGLSAWYLCRAFPIDSSARLTNVIVAQLAAAGMAAAVWAALGHLWSRALDALTGGVDAYVLYTQQRPMLFAVGALLYWLAAAGHYLFLAFLASRDAETRAFAQTLLARDAELKALRAQIDPHFIFNSLHSISALTTADAASARRMCLLLADFLRDTLRIGSNTRISLADEWSLAERFLAIEQVRLGARLQVTEHVDPEAAHCLIPPLLLQPLVENAVAHGISQLVEGGIIQMTARLTGSTLTVVVENPCDPDRLRTRGVGLGLELLRKRLTTEFGSYDAIQVEERAGRFRVEVRIPIQTPAS
jgi:two-component system, LytTR family, sensor histidine kinase AlgZ